MHKTLDRAAWCRLYNSIKTAMMSPPLGFGSTFPSSYYYWHGVNAKMGGKSKRRNQSKQNAFAYATYDRNIRTHGTLFFSLVINLYIESSRFSGSPCRSSITFWALVFIFVHVLCDSTRVFRPRSSCSSYYVSFDYCLWSAVIS